MRQEKLPAGLLFLATFLLFLPVVGFGFLNWDDGLNILDNSRARGFSLSSFVWWWTAFHGGHYMPLTWMSYAADYSLWGLGPRGYHLTNLLLHGANAALAFFLLRRVVGLALGRPAPAWAIALAAAWWAWHPMRVESVAWVSQRRDLLASVLLLAAALAYLRARSPVAGDARPWGAAAFTLFVLSLFAKAIGAVFPAVLVVLDLYPLRRREPLRRLVSEKAFYWALSAAFLAVAALAQKEGGALTSWDVHPWIRRLAQSFYGLAHGALATAVPLTPRLVHEFPVPFRAWSAPFILSATVVLGAAGALLRLRRPWPAGAAAAAVFAIFLSPTLGLLQSGPQFTASRYTYLAALAPAALLAGGLALARGRAAAGAAAAVLLWTAAGAYQTMRRLPAWRDGVSFWTEAGAESPGSPLVWNNLGQALLVQERWGEALEALDRVAPNAQNSLRRGPILAETEGNRGYIYLKLERWAEAEASLRRSLDLEPGNPQERSNLGLVLLHQRRTKEALPELARAASDAPSFAEGRLNHGVGLARAGRAEEALAEFDAAAALAPESAAAQYNKALLLGAMGRREEALSAWERARRLDPSLAPPPAR